MKPNGFLLALALAVVAAWFFPQLHAGIPLGTIIDIGIGLIFFFYGLGLSVSELGAGIKNHKLHLLVQLFTFLFFPLLLLAFYPIANDGGWLQYWKAFFFLAAVPSTVSSSVILVSLAKGNIPAAVFNASLSGVIGVVVTPFWLGFFVQNPESPGFGEIVSGLLLQIVLPLFLGFLLRRFLRELYNTHRNRLKLFDKSVIVLIVYSAFSTSFASGLFAGLGFWKLALVFLGVLTLFLFAYFGIGYLSKKMRFGREDSITAKFCGSQKSLVHGSAMAKVIFGGSAAMGVFLLPLMLYHFIQLMLISWFVGKESQKRK
jgi:sodium/bile acid cotransporter 7